MRAVGVSPLTEDFKSSNLDDPMILDAMQKFAQPIYDGLFPDPAEVVAHGTAETFFAEGKIAMYISQGSSCTAINKFNPDMRYDAQIMPIGWNGERSCIYVPNVWVIAKSASDVQKEASWEWLKHYLSEESQMFVADTILAGYPIMKSALDTVSKNGIKPDGKDAFYRGIDEFGTTILENPCSTEVNTIVTNMATKIRRKQGPIEEVIAEAHNELKGSLDYFYEQAN